MSSHQAPNVAAVLPSKQAQLTIQERPIPTPGDGEILVHNHAIAANPVDWKIQSYGIFIEDFPAILGSDIAGEVVSVGSGVTRFKAGDRVLGFAAKIAGKGNDHAAWQTYSLLKEFGATHLPKSMSYEDGAVLPMGVATAGMGLHVDLGIPMGPRSSNENSAILVWSAATSVGSAAVQLAHSLGWPVYATASPKNHDWIKKLGATQVWDYRDEQVSQKISETVKSAGLKFRGAFDGISEAPSFSNVEDTLKATGTTADAKIVTVLPWPDDKPKPEGIEVSNTYAGRFAMDKQEVGEWLFGKWLEQGLQNGTVKPVPEPEIVEGGVQAAQKVFDQLKAGVSGKKLVVQVK